MSRFLLALFTVVALFGSCGPRTQPPVKTPPPPASVPTRPEPPPSTPIPTPGTDCAVTEWGPWSEWSAWAPHPGLPPNIEVRVRVRARKIITQPIGSGIPCPKIMETETEVRVVGEL